MAAETAPHDSGTAPKGGGIHRFQIGVNVIIQVAVVLFLAAMVNYLGFEHYRRWDLSRDKKYELSDKTKRFLDSIKGKVRMTLLFAPNEAIGGDVQNLLTEYQYAAKGKIDVEIIDPARNFSRAKEAIDKYKVVANESMLILDYDGRNRAVKASEMAEMDQGNPMVGEPPKMVAFKGEQAITSALIDLVEGKKNTLGYVLGHKEPELAPEGPVSVLKTFIENENVTVTPLNLFEVEAIPAEMKTIFINAPQYDFSDREMKLFRDFWEKGGRVLLLLDPAAKLPKLTAFLNALGVRPNDDRLMANVRTGIQEVARVRDVVAHFLGDSPVTKRLADAQAPFFGGACSLTLEPDRVRAANIRVQPLIEAEKGYWGETDYNSDDDAKLQFDPAKDHGPPLYIAASVEKGGSSDENAQANSSRLVVVSTAAFAQNQALTEGQQGLDFVSGSVNWLLNREQLIGIAPKVPKPLTFVLDAKALSGLRWLILVLMPLIPAVLGTAVWWRRRA